MTKFAYPVGSAVVFLKQKGGWSFFNVFPPGSQVPSASLPLGKHFKSSLAEALAKILEYSSDEPLAGGHPPSVDPTSSNTEPYPLGTLIWITKSERSWVPVSHFPGGGISQRSAPYSSLADVVTGIKLLHGET